MSQQINLINPSLIKQKDFLNANTILITLGVLLAFMLSYYSYAQKQLSLLTAQRSQVAQELSTAQAALQQATLLHTPHEMNKALLEQIAQLEQKETMQQLILETVNQSSATPEKGYAALMRAFAKQSLNGIWLTSFSIESKSERLNISGRALDGSLVPEYITRLGSEPSLKGKKFTSLLMSQAKKDSSDNANPSPVVQAAQTVRSSNPTAMVIKNGVSTLPATSTSAPAVSDQDSEANYIEFSLQSTEDKSTAVTNEAKAGATL